MCERCPAKDRLVRFYDPQTDCTLILCPGCFDALARTRRKLGLPVPNTRRIEPCATIANKITA